MCAVIHYTLEEHPFFRDWTGDEIAIIRDTITELDVTAGQVLFNPGDASVGCYLVESGEVALFSTLDGQLHEIDRRGPGDSFGEVSMITGEPHRMRAMAVVDSHLAKIPTRGNSKCLFGEFNCPLIRVMRPMVRHLGSTAMISARKAREKDQLALIGRMVNDIVHDFKSPFQTIALGTETIGRLT
ncbi:MAG TPA: cyclic nucleotide-binding domain-containing protein [Opitutales bacterium]|nr:cyclic nucleotide-binding domain-containing protein [Opitutales bacterium]